MCIEGIVNAYENYVQGQVKGISRVDSRYIK